MEETRITTQRKFRTVRKAVSKIKFRVRSYFRKEAALLKVIISLGKDL